MYLLWLRVAAVLYAAGAVAVFPAVLYGQIRARRWCVHLAGMALFFHFVSAVEMLIQQHTWRPVGMAELESLLALAVAAIFFLVWWLYDAVAMGIFALPVIFFLLFIPSLGTERYVFPSEGVRISWLVAHIAALMAAYVALGFSLVASILYQVQEGRLKAKKHLPGEARQAGLGFGLDWMPPLDTLERMAHALLEFGFPCITVGLLIGSVLAETTQGAAYFLDAKVIASFAMWVVYVALLLVRRSAGLRGRRAAWLSGAVFLVMIAVLAANVISRVHRFGPQ